VSASCNRVAVTEGHLESVSIELEQKVEPEQIIQAWNGFTGNQLVRKLPSAPEQPIKYLENPAYPQPRLHRNFAARMGVSTGRLRKCSLFDYKYSVLSHNTVRGAAGGAILNAELIAAQGLLGTSPPQTGDIK